MLGPVNLASPDQAAVTKLNIKSELPELTELDEAELLADGSHRRFFAKVGAWRLSFASNYAACMPAPYRSPGAGVETDPDEQAFWSYAEGRAADKAPPPTPQHFVV